MTTTPKTITGTARLQEAVDLMNSHKITMLFVVEGAEPIGAIHIHDCLRAGVPFGICSIFWARYAASSSQRGG